MTKDIAFHCILTSSELCFRYHCKHNKSLIIHISTLLYVGINTIGNRNRMSNKLTRSMKLTCHENPLIPPTTTYINFTSLFLSFPAGVRKVGLYNDNGFVRNLPDLVMGRYDHACAGFQDINGDMVGVILFYSWSRL